MRNIWRKLQQTMIYFSHTTFSSEVVWLNSYTFAFLPYLYWRKNIQFNYSNCSLQSVQHLHTYPSWIILFYGFLSVIWLFLVFCSWNLQLRIYKLLSGWTCFLFWMAITTPHPELFFHSFVDSINVPSHKPLCAKLIGHPVATVTFIWHPLKIINSISLFQYSINLWLHFWYLIRVILRTN